MKHFIEISKAEADLLSFLLATHEAGIKDSVKRDGAIEVDFDDYYTARSLRERLLNTFKESDHDEG